MSEDYLQDRPRPAPKHFAPRPSQPEPHDCIQPEQQDPLWPEKQDFVQPEQQESRWSEQQAFRQTDSQAFAQPQLQDPPQPELPSSRMPLWLDLLTTVAGALVLAVLVRIFVAETYQVPSGSMLETIQLGDRLVGEKVTLHWSAPKQGDIVTFEDPLGSGSTLIKRVIATEGQVVDLVDGAVVVDGVTLDEPYVLGKPSQPLNERPSFLEENISFPLTVPEGCIWVMGDNRTNSRDSRFFGPIPLSSVTSKALFIYWPISDVKWL